MKIVVSVRKTTDGRFYWKVYSDTFGIVRMPEGESVKTVGGAKRSWCWQAKKCGFARSEWQYATVMDGVEVQQQEISLVG